MAVHGHPCGRPPKERNGPRLFRVSQRPWNVKAAGRFFQRRVKAGRAPHRRGTRRCERRPPKGSLEAACTMGERRPDPRKQWDERGRRVSAGGGSPQGRRPRASPEAPSGGWRGREGRQGRTPDEHSAHGGALNGPGRSTRGQGPARRPGRGARGPEERRRKATNPRGAGRPPRRNGRRAKPGGAKRPQKRRRGRRLETEGRARAEARAPEAKRRKPAAERGRGQGADGGQSARGAEHRGEIERSRAYRRDGRARAAPPGRGRREKGAGGREAPAAGGSPAATRARRGYRRGYGARFFEPHPGREGGPLWAAGAPARSPAILAGCRTTTRPRSVRGTALWLC